MSNKNFKAEYVEKGICPICEADREIEVGKRKHSIIIRKEPTEVISRVEHCPVCDEFFASTEDEEEAIQKAYREYRSHHGLLQPEEIKSIREHYGLGQRAFSRVLGWGEITIHRYEAGSIQDEAHNDTLFLVRDADNFAQLFERNKNALPKRVANRVSERLAAMKEESREECLQDFLGSQFMKARDDILSGYRHFDLDKFEAAIIFFCERLDNVFKTKLNKLLWYFDFYCYKKQLRSATGAVYIHLPYGPVPDSYDFFLANLVREDVLEPQEVIFDEEKRVAGETFQALEEPEIDLFNQTELECLELVASHFGKMTAKEISEHSHNEEGYIKTKNGEVISYEWSELIEFSQKK